MHFYTIYIDIITLVTKSCIGSDMDCDRHTNTDPKMAMHNIPR